MDISSQRVEVKNIEQWGNLDLFIKFWWKMQNWRYKIQYLRISIYRLDEVSSEFSWYIIEQNLWMFVSHFSNNFQSLVAQKEFWKWKLRKILKKFTVAEKD